MKTAVIQLDEQEIRLADIPLHKLTKEHCKAFKTALTKTLKWTYAKKHLTSFKSILTQARADDLMDDDPAEFVFIRAPSREPDFNIEDDAVKILSNKTIDPKDLELFYTSAENPIYEFLYDSSSEDGFLDGECLLDHSYFLGHQLKGLSEVEAESVFSEIERLSKH
ncbi:MAG: phage integrase SAM-like domain-containing protein [Nitrospinae bacterium]|nr:phage integrase SAM-like domain-containing protein [Nitrospinota bacterium]